MTAIRVVSLALLTACTSRPAVSLGVEEHLTSVSHCDGLARVTEYRDGTGRVFATAIVWEDPHCGPEGRP